MSEDNGWSDEVSGPRRNQPRRSRGFTLGRRRTDATAANLITRKVIIVTVIAVDAFYLAGETLLTRSFSCF